MDVGRPRGVPGLEAPLTGRDEELSALLDAADRAQSGRKAVLFTIFGVPGVGKSRLTREATARLSANGWQVYRGRCLPYGEGITYWPVAEIARPMAGIDADMAPDQDSTDCASYRPTTTRPTSWPSCWAWLPSGRARSRTPRRSPTHSDDWSSRSVQRRHWSSSSRTFTGRSRHCSN